MLSGDYEVEEGFEFVGDGGVELIEDSNGFCPHALHCGIGIVDTAVLMGEFDEAADVAVGQCALLAEHGYHLLASGSIGLGKRIEQRKCHLTFAEVVSGGFTYDFGIEIIEDVILYLETASEEFSKFADGPETPVVDTCAICAHRHAGHEKRCSLVGYDLEI